MKNSQEEENISEILDAVQKIASGDFSARVPLSDRQDAYNAIANGINMLAEEVEAYSNEKEDQSEALLNMLEDINVAKENVREERDRAQKYLDIAGVMIVAMNTAGEVTQINKKGCEILGYTEGEIIGRNWFENFLPERLKSKVKPVSEQLLAGGSQSAQYFENAVLTKGGEERIITWHNRILHDENGNIIGHLSSGEDITERKMAQEALRKSERKYRKLSERLKGESAQINLLYNYSQALRNATRIEKIVEVLNDTITEMKDFDHVFVTLLDESGSYLVGIEAGKKTKLRTQIEKLVGLRTSDLKISMEQDNVFSRVMKSGEMIIETDRKTNVKNLCDITGKGKKTMSMVTTMGRINTGISVPLVAWEGDSEKKILGVMGVSSSKVKFDETETKLLKAIANHTGVAIHRLQTSRKLRESEEKYRLLVDNANEAIVVAQDGVLKFSNPNAAQLTGYSVAELSSKPFTDFIHPEDRTMVADRYVKRLKGEDVPHSYALRIMDRAGHTKWVEINAVRIGWEGKPATLNFMSNITERRKAEEDMRNSEERLKIIFEHAPDPYYMMDLEGNFIDGNKTIEDLIGYKREELMGKNLADTHLMGSVQLAKARGLLARNIRGDTTGPDEFVLIRKDGSEVNVEIRSHPVIIRDQTVILGLARDITDRKKAEKALIESEEKLRRILESSPDAITVTDLYGNITECNQATLDMHGFSSKDEILGVNAFDYIAEKDRTRAMEAMMETLEHGHTKNLEYSLQTKNGRLFPAELSASVIMDQNENPTSFVTITKDITERKRAEEELIQSEKLAGIGTLASGVAHEVNNPLAGIMGYAEIIQEEDDLDKIREYTEKILKNTNRASDIVRWLSRYSRQAKDTDIRDVNLQDVIDDSLEALTHTRRSSDIEVIKDFQRIPAIKGNRSELLQIFVNLMNNSVDAMPKGGKLNLISSVNDRTVEVRVHDNGKGIPKDRLKRIFDPFFTTKEVGKGTGLGLYVSSMIVKKHHGTIEVESEEGMGTTIKMRFPISEVRT